MHQANISCRFILSAGDASSRGATRHHDSVVAPWCLALQIGVNAMRKAETSAARSVQSVLGPDYEVVEFDESTGTSAEAAAAIGCAVAQIAKSIVFRSTSGGPV